MGRKSLVLCAVAVVALLASSLDQVAAKAEITEESIKQLINELSPICKEELKHTFSGGDESADPEDVSDDCKKEMEEIIKTKSNLGDSIEADAKQAQQIKEYEEANLARTAARKARIQAREDKKNNAAAMENYIFLAKNLGAVAAVAFIVYLVNKPKKVSTHTPEKRQYYTKKKKGGKKNK